MSLKERDRLVILNQVKGKGMTLVEASDHLGLSYRQIKRLWRRYGDRGDAGLVHGLRGRSSNNASSADARRDQALGLYREHYRGFGPTLAAEQMLLRDGLQVDHETLRRWLASEGLWKARRQPRRSHRRRERRACFGELVQLDGSDHAWFGPEHPRCVVMVMIDDATNRMQARFFEAETTHAAMTIFRQWVLRYGLPRTVYPDCHSIYRRNDKQADELAHRTGKRPLTRFGEAMEDLGVKLTCAHSPQAKGRVERVNATLQDRLVKLLRLEGITDIASANTYMETTYLTEHNERFTVSAVDSADAHGPSLLAEQLDAVLCPVRERRVVDGSGCVSWRGRCFELTGRDATPRRRRQVLVRERLSGQVDLVSLDGATVLASRERAHRQASQPTVVLSLAERVAEHAGPQKPAAAHPWRSAPAVDGCVAARCAHLHYAIHRGHTKGHFY